VGYSPESYKEGWVTVEREKNAQIERETIFDMAFFTPLDGRSARCHSSI